MTSNRDEAMHRLPPDKRVYLQPGEHRAVGEPMILSTLLGSCVSACLFDPIAKVSGMNHFLLANKRYSKEMPMSLTEAGRYGINAMELLINDLLKLGAKRSRLRAKIFGGSTLVAGLPESNFLCVGEVNKRFIHEFLALEAIPVDADDTGGQWGRVIHFHTDNLKVWRRYIKNHAIDGEIVRAEEKVWQQGVAAAGKEGEAILF
jgi:chemotaxis protein CheD